MPTFSPQTTADRCFYREQLPASLPTYTWCYDDQEHWPRWCYGLKQSPIPLAEYSAIPMHYAPFKIENYDKPYSGIITNTGDAIRLELLIPLSESSPSITNGGLFQEYVLHSIYFHWEAEHVINEQRYPLEVQFVHYGKKYENLANAKKYKDGVAILATFYQVDSTSNEVIETIVATVPNISRKIAHSFELEKPINPLQLLPAKFEKFYRYHGSFTQPDCEEVVTWTLFSKPRSITESQLKQLTNIWATCHKPLKKNFRNLQCINKRRIYLSKI